MKANQYKIMEISDGDDSKHGKIWIVKANPVEENQYSGAKFFTSYIDENTELFFIPYNNSLVDEIEDIAKEGKLWTPNKNEWQEEAYINEDIAQKCVINRFITTQNNSDNNNLILSDKKPLKQLVLEQNAVVKTYKTPKSDKLFFECGKIRGYVSPAAAERLEDPQSTLNDFEFAMVTKRGNTAIPCIMLSSKKRVTKEETYHSLLGKIKEKYVINSAADFDLIDASFVFEVLNLLHIQQGKTLGFYRKQDDIVDRSFVAKPYVHNTNANKAYNPVITPKKKTISQRLGISSKNFLEGSFDISESYSTDYILRGIVDRRILNDLYSSSTINIGQYISLPKTEEAIWQMFLLDKIEYFLPKYDHGVYKDRKLVLSINDAIDLPLPIKQFVQQHNNSINPIITINNTEELVSIQCIYFNKWQGLIKWTIFYKLFGGFFTDHIRMSNIKHMEKQDILVKYDCGIRL